MNNKKKKAHNQRLRVPAGEVCDTTKSASWEMTTWKTKYVIQWQHCKVDGRKQSCGARGIVLDGGSWCDVLHGRLIVIRDGTAKDEVGSICSIMYT